MEKIAKPTREELRRIQAALDAVNVAYEYFTPAPVTATEGGEKAAEYLPYEEAA
ncbi:MAG: hypothetical protein ACPH5G_09435 [Pseudooceanicola atlanticus]